MFVPYKQTQLVQTAAAGNLGEFGADENEREREREREWKRSGMEAEEASQPGQPASQASQPQYASMAIVGRANYIR